MNLFNVIAIVIVIATFFAYFNQRLLKLPNNIGVMIIAIAVSLLLIFTNNLVPEFFRNSIDFIGSVDYSRVVIGVVLNFLLFAGTIQLRIKDLKEQQLPVILYSTIGVIISTFIVGILMYWVVQLIGIPVPLDQCLLFGALISPTDPVSILSILSKSGMPKSLETKITGESLFNDGISLIIFVSILRSIHNPEDTITIKDVLLVFVHEVLGGLVLGIVLGFIGFRAMKSIDDHKIDVMITLSIVMGGYVLATSFGISAPLTMVAAGIFIGNYGRPAMSEVSHDYISKFWELIDEILNIIVFVLIGLELLLIKDFRYYWQVGLAAIPIVLVARFISILLPSFIVRLKQKLSLKTVSFLTWGGLRGGISIALALSLGYDMHKNLIIFTTYCVVVFTIIVQGLTIQKIVGKTSANEETPNEI